MYIYIRYIRYIYISWVINITIFKKDKANRNVISIAIEMFKFSQLGYLQGSRIN